MAEVETLLGLDGVLYFNPGGIAEGTGWAEVTNVQDLAMPLKKTEADVTTRATGGWEAIKGALKSLELSFSMIKDSTDTGYLSAQDSFLNGTMLGVRVLDYEDGPGFQFDGEVMTFTDNQKLKEAMTVDVVIKITRSQTPPSVVAAS